MKGTKTSITTSAVHYVHCDQSYYGAKAIFLTRIPDYDVAEEIVDKKRFAVYNVSCGDSLTLSRRDMSISQWLTDPTHTSSGDQSRPSSGTPSHA